MNIKTFIIMCLLFPIAAIAQNSDITGISKEDTQRTMQLMQEMQKCMEKIDTQERTLFATQSQQLGVEIDALCNAGDRAEAQKKAEAFAEKMTKHPVSVQMKKCGELMGDLQVNIPAISAAEEDLDFSRGHVCDNR